ncbi:Pycsar system effector family protein [Streptomyces atacamensis]|uniref:Pycsar system effector family protein n=1 Tax=Streptomyces atacamensis TaxID=531966 RepID=UPI00399CD1BC
MTACRTHTGLRDSHTDGKASLLPAFNGAVLAGLASAADTGLPPAIKVFGGAAAFALGIAAVLLLLVVRPCLNGADHDSFPYWARLDEAAVRACAGGDPRPAQVRVMSIIAMAKSARLRWAVDCSLTALALLALAAAGAAW